MRKHNLNNQVIAGQYHDWESGLHYNWHRYYRTSLGRYITADPIGLAGGINPYSYANQNPLKYVDREGLVWEYSQSSGQLTHIDDETGDRTLIAKKGYSGSPEGLNNPKMQDIKNTGPIPQGDWKIGRPILNHPRLQYPLPLTPRPGTPTFGRDNFLIHGPRKNDQQDSSRGCPIFSRSIRTRIVDSNDPILRVIP